MDNNNTEEKLPEQETIDAPEPQAKWVFILNWKYDNDDEILLLK